MVWGVGAYTIRSLVRKDVPNCYGSLDEYAREMLYMYMHVPHDHVYTVSI